MNLLYYQYCLSVFIMFFFSALKGSYLRDLKVFALLPALTRFPVLHSAVYILLLYIVYFVET